MDIVRSEMIPALLGHPAHPETKYNHSAPHMPSSPQSIWPAQQAHAEWYSQQRQVPKLFDFENLESQKKLAFGAVGYANLWMIEMASHAYGRCADYDRYKLSRCH